MLSTSVSTRSHTHEVLAHHDKCDTRVALRSRVRFGHVAGGEAG
jgi:hypothetical protein